MTLSDPTSLVRAFRAALAPPPATRVSEWAELRRYLPTETAADAGPWRNAKTPWSVEIMDEFSPSSMTQTVVAMTSARVTKTETINNVVGFYMDLVRCPIMVAQPIEADAEEWSKDHLDPMIAHTPSLSALVTPDKDRRKGNTILHKKYAGGVIYAVGANSGKSFRRRTVRVGLADELDAWPGLIADEGDPWRLFEARTATYPFSRKLGAFSTPTIAGQSRIEKLFLASDQRYFHVPCPECGHEQRLVFGRLAYDVKVLDQFGRPVTEYVCESCECLIPEHRRDAMVARGRWVPTFPGRPIAGFHISQLYSPWVSWSELVAAYLEAHADPLQLQVFTNTRLGETFDVSDSDQWDPDSLMRLREEIPRLPARALVLTSSVDTQGDRLVMQVDAWARGEERWTLDRFDLIGDPKVDPDDPRSVWQELDRAFVGYSYPHETQGALRIRVMLVDTGGLASDQAYKFCRARRSRRVYAIKGDSGREGSPVWPRVPSRKNKGKLPLYMLGVFAGKETCMARLKSSTQAMLRGEAGGPGYWHINAREALGQSYLDELTAEVCVYDTARARGGRATSEKRRRWVLRRADRRNEGLDCSVYSYAGLCALYAQGFRLDRVVGVVEAGSGAGSFQARTDQPECLKTSIPAVKAGPEPTAKADQRKPHRKVAPSYMFRDDD